jgi:hypothetical protein
MMIGPHEALVAVEETDDVVGVGSAFEAAGAATRAAMALESTSEAMRREIDMR